MQRWEAVPKEIFEEYLVKHRGYRKAIAKDMGLTTNEIGKMLSRYPDLKRRFPPMCHVNDSWQEDLGWFNSDLEEDALSVQDLLDIKITAMKKSLTYRMSKPDEQERMVKRLTDLYLDLSKDSM